ncbi:MAG: hypothetical protein P4L41_04075 [Flavipsychrobacter sp.]|nr:hypothetical protein [Flavipsychrobacter sp.]
MKKVLVLFCFLTSSIARAQIITTWAGNGPGGGLDGVGDGLHKDSATFTAPVNIFFDKAGNFYVTDQGEHRVRKVDTNSIITCIAGTGANGYNGSAGSTSILQLNQPASVITDSINNIYIADFVNYRILKIDHLTGLISTIAGTGASGISGDNGPAVNAQLSAPFDICFDKHSNLLIADHNRIRKINSIGTITSIAGNDSHTTTVNGGLADTSAIGVLGAICTDRFENIFIADAYNSRIYKIDNAGTITVFAGNGNAYYNDDNIPAINAQINPGAIKIDPKTGNLFLLMWNRITGYG